MDIEKATHKEWASIIEIDAMLVGNHNRKYFIKDAIKAGRCLAALTSGKVVGYGILENTFYGQGFIGLLVVHPEYRRRGIATALIRRIETICPTKKLFTSTNKSNIIAQKTYEANGFVRSGHIDNLDEGDPEIIYFKHLAGVDAGGSV